jgi:hypothetical protein
MEKFGLKMFLIHKLKLNVNLDEIRNYYNTVVNDFNYLKWSRSLDDIESGVGGHSFENLYGWGIESNQPDIDQPCPPYNVLKLKNEYKETKLVFGPILNLKKLFPNSHQYSIAGHPSGTRVNLHRDSDKYLKIHIPIYTNPSAEFIFKDNKYHLPADGSIYLVNTQVMHGTDNQGTTDRVHLFFKVPSTDLNKILEL